MKDFKDMFFPGKRWNPATDNISEDRRRMDAISDNMSIETESVAISTIMQGRTNEELFEAREMEERKQLMRDQMKKNQMKMDNPTLMEEFETHSAASMPLDEILNMR